VGRDQVLVHLRQLDLGRQGIAFHQHARGQEVLRLLYMARGRLPGLAGQILEALGQQGAEVGRGDPEIDRGGGVLFHRGRGPGHAAGLADAVGELAPGEEGHGGFNLGGEVVQRVRPVGIPGHEGGEGEALLHELQAEGVGRRVGAHHRFPESEGRKAAQRCLPAGLARGFVLGPALSDGRVVLPGQHHRLGQGQGGRGGVRVGRGILCPGGFSGSCRLECGQNERQGQDCDQGRGRGPGRTSRSYPGCASVLHVGSISFPGGQAKFLVCGAWEFDASLVFLHVDMSIC
jgi:hypothetical protein